MKVYFSHGKESGPWGSKIKRLAASATHYGYDVESIDYTSISSPDLRVEKLIGSVLHDDEIILVGSSMGGYVSLVAASQLNAKAIFLLAPALYMAGYSQQNYATSCPSIEVIHGWSDDVIPVEHSIKFARENNCTLHLIDGDHRLNSSIEVVSDIFESFLVKQLKSKQINESSDDSTVT